VSYIHVVIRESRVHIIQLPVIKSATFCNNWTNIMLRNVSFGDIHKV
jgi:hypothetical protein